MTRTSTATATTPSPVPPIRRQMCGIGILHSPEPAVLDRFAADGFDLLLAGHTHGGQICLPGSGPW
jgi:predicted MPP superfamily phosphohydrolase